MIYIDSSVALAQLMFEPRSPPEALWRQPLASSRLLEYEIWNRIQAYGLARSHAGNAQALLALVQMIEMTQAVLARALRPFPRPVRTLDALHLATAQHLGILGERIEIASYDKRLLAAAQALGITLAAL